MQKKSTTSSDIVPAEVRPRTATEGRRRRPSSHAPKVVAAKPAPKVRAKATVVRPVREDKREAPLAMDTDARPKNAHAAGSGTRGLEATSPGKRPTRKSTRGGKNRVKPDSQQRRRVTRALASPESRAARG